MVKFFRRLPAETLRRLELELNGRYVPLPRNARPAQNGQPRGYEAEERFYGIVERALMSGRLPSWFAKVERGTAEEDAMGIDMVVTVEGDYRIPVQIKSSQLGRKKFYERDDRRHIICIVVAHAKPDEEILSTTLEEITFVFEAIQRAAAG